jgi:hypothetical protein
MVLSEEHPRVIRYRSPRPVLTPDLPRERRGTVANVVFPTGIDRRDDLGAPDCFDVYYGMADNRIGVARLDLPECPPPGALADHPEQKVYILTGGEGQHSQWTQVDAREPERNTRGHARTGLGWWGDRTC